MHADKHLSPYSSTASLCNSEPDGSRQGAPTNGFVFPEPMGKWVGRVIYNKEPGDELVRVLLNQEELYFVVDPPKYGINVDALTACKKLVFSSPHSLSANSLKNDSYMRFMPVWTFEELQQARDAAGLGLSDEELDERFKIFGGTCSIPTTNGRYSSSHSTSAVSRQTRAQTSSTNDK
jgi:hypothetical protein